jgi:hypothetical protein
VKNDVNVPSKVISKKTLGEKIFFIAILKITDEKSRIRRANPKIPVPAFFYVH